MSARSQRAPSTSPSRLASLHIPFILYAALSILSLQAATPVHLPYLQNMREDRVTIIWSAQESLPARVEYSTDRSFSLSAPAQVRMFTRFETGLPYVMYQYRADLSGLAPGTVYFYRVIPEVGSEEGRQFRTASSGSFTFLVFGDSGAGTAGQQLVTLEMDKQQPNFVVHVGDIAYQEGTFEQFTANYFSYYASLMRRASFFTAPGNHEYYTPDAVPYLALHAPPLDTVPLEGRGRYYSFDWSNAHFVALDSNLLLDPGMGPAMLQWLERDLVSTRASWRIVFFHHVPYPISQHVDDPLCKAARELVVPIVERNGVQLVLTGHEHNYQRSKPMRGGSVVSSGRSTLYLTSGGGGGGLHPAPPRDYLAFQAAVYHYMKVEVSATQMIVRAFDSTGREFDGTVLTLPALRAETVLNAASFTTALAPGGLVSIFGTGLASDISRASSLPLPGVLAGSSVTLNGASLPLLFASPTQINAQLPVDALGPATVRIITPNGVADAFVTISETAPAIFPSGVLHEDGRPVSSAAPARAGETLVVYMTGLGRVDGDIATGQPAPFFPLLRVTAPVEVQIGDVAVTPAFAGLTPGFVGVYQVNVQVPSDLPGQAYGLRVSAKGNLSNTMTVQVQGRVP
jgi:uncharacterized protein (TIGR03437 family)